MESCFLFLSPVPRSILPIFFFLYAGPGFGSQLCESYTTAGSPLFSRALFPRFAVFLFARIEREYFTCFANWISSCSKIRKWTRFVFCSFYYLAGCRVFWNLRRVYGSDIYIYVTWRIWLTCSFPPCRGYPELCGKVDQHQSHRCLPSPPMHRMCDYLHMQRSILPFADVEPTCISEHLPTIGRS